jgi:thiol-disulfide isomerase/thioredoxin
MLVLAAVLFTATHLPAAEGSNPPEPPLPYDGAANVDPQGLVLSWPAVSGARSYDVYLGTSSNDLVLQGNVSQTQYVPTAALAAGRCYYWQVYARATGMHVTPGPTWRFAAAAPQPKDAGLLAWYTFDEALGGVSRDLSGKGFDAQVEQMTWGAAGTPGVDGASVRSNGSGWAHFQIPTRPQSADSLTLAGWFFVREQEEPAAMWSLGNGQGSYASFVVQPPDRGGPIVETLGAAQSNPVRSQVKDPLPVDHWTHLAFVMDGPGRQITVYEDGAVVWTVKGLTDLTSVLQQAHEVFVGTSFVLDSCLKGGADEVRLYSRALDVAGVARAMSGHPEGPYEPSPRHWAQAHVSGSNALRWQPADSATAYNLYTGTSPDRLSLAAGGLTKTEHTLKQPPASGQTLYWRVEAARADGFVTGPLWQYSVTGSSLANLDEDDPAWWTDFGKYYRQIAPDVSLTDVDGLGHRLRDYRGRQLLVVVWAPWCSVCRTELTRLAGLVESMGEDRLAILTLTDEANRASLMTFLPAHPEVTLPVCVTKLASLPAPFGSVSHLPTCFYIAPDGLIKLATVGGVPLASMEEILNAAWPPQ